MDHGWASGKWTINFLDFGECRLWLEVFIIAEASMGELTRVCMRERPMM